MMRSCASPINAAVAISAELGDGNVPPKDLLIDL